MASYYTHHQDVIHSVGVDYESRVIRIRGEITSKKWEKFDAQLTEMERLSRKTITVRIHSEGGDTYSGLAIAGRLQKSIDSNINIITEGYGCIMSAASLIFVSGKKRRISRLAQFMHHEGSQTFRGRMAELENEVRQNKREWEIWCGHLANCSNETHEFYAEIGRYLDYYIPVDKLLEYGLADEVI